MKINILVLSAGFITLAAIEGCGSSQPAPVVGQKTYPANSALGRAAQRAQQSREAFANSHAGRVPAHPGQDGTGK